MNDDSFAQALNGNPFIAAMLNKLQAGGAQGGNTPPQPGATMGVGPSAAQSMSSIFPSAAPNIGGAASPLAAAVQGGTGGMAEKAAAGGVNAANAAGAGGAAGAGMSLMEKAAPWLMAVQALSNYAKSNRMQMHSGGGPYEMGGGSLL